MFDWFRRKQEPVVSFRDNEAAFAHACTMGYRLLLNALIPALVVDVGRRGGEGERYFRLRLAEPDGTREIWGCTMADAPGYPEVGDLVAFRIVRIATELPKEAQLIGYIACKLAPVLNRGKGWQIAASFTPAHLKPELHL
ncbi:hypothetical protein F6V30_07765 [Oryzomonas sagensis]|uniref:DUF35 domain-containing protein n=1 Tax=Oryzomonas sagensis TaxID=2603857 RepID=A0ABQ6TUN0_9BACT|nr:hypothetical protein [Oryzomonas sagensis]KAB0672449.1 hypothetical protein F6V30_07765 [Oryzomonas sagensis]